MHRLIGRQFTAIYDHTVLLELARAITKLREEIHRLSLQEKETEQEFSVQRVSMVQALKAIKRLSDRDWNEFAGEEDSRSKSMVTINNKAISALLAVGEV